jgi:transposase
LRTTSRIDSVLLGQALRGVGELGRDPVHHGAASLSTQTVNPPKPISGPSATEPHAANIQDRDGAKLVFAKAKGMGPWLRMEHVWADGGYAGKLIASVSSLRQWVLEIVNRNDDVKGFKLLPKRWLVERAFSWLSNYRRLSKYYEYWNATGEAMIHLVMIHLILCRLTKP